VTCGPLPEIYGFELGGAQITHFIQASYPRADFLGRVLYFNGGVYGILTAFDAVSGEVVWTADAHHYPVVDPQSNVYSSLQDADLHLVSYASDGSTRWVSAEADHVYKMLAVRPDGASVLYAGSVPDNPPDFVSSVSAADGAVEWSVPLRPMIPYNDEEIVWSEEAVYSPDGATAYFTTWADNNARVPALWAVAASDGGPGDLDGDGVVGITDFLALLGAWGVCPDPPDPCPADLDGDGSVGITDLLNLLGNWS
jgi:outer membrane protein assembly factor BamB